MDYSFMGISVNFCEPEPLENLMEYTDSETAEIMLERAYLDFINNITDVRFNVINEPGLTVDIINLHYF